MTDITHAFEAMKRDSRYCGFMYRTEKKGKHGSITFASQCGYPPSSHPETAEVTE